MVQYCIDRTTTQPLSCNALNRIITEDTKTLLLLQPNVDWLSSLGMCGPSYYHFSL